MDTVGFMRRHGPDDQPGTQHQGLNPLQNIFPDSPANALYLDRQAENDNLSEFLYEA